MSLSQRREKVMMVTEAIKAWIYYVGVQTVIFKEFLIIYCNNTRFFLSTWSPVQCDSYIARKQAIRESFWRLSNVIVSA